MVKLRGCKGRGVPVVGCIPTTGSGVWWVGCGGVGVGVGVWRLRVVGGAVKEGGREGRLCGRRREGSW